MDAEFTVAACGSSPQAQCMAGSWLSVFDDLVISSESLFGDVGREFPGLRWEEIANSHYSVNTNNKACFVCRLQACVCLVVWCGTLSPLEGTPLAI